MIPSENGWEMFSKSLEESEDQKIRRSELVDVNKRKFMEELLEGTAQKEMFTFCEGIKETKIP